MLSTALAPSSPAAILKIQIASSHGNEAARAQFTRLRAMATKRQVVMATQLRMRSSPAYAPWQQSCACAVHLFTRHFKSK